MTSADHARGMMLVRRREQPGMLSDSPGHCCGPSVHSMGRMHTGRRQGHAPLRWLALTVVCVLRLEAGEALPVPVIDLDAAWRIVAVQPAPAALRSEERCSQLMAMAGIAMLGDPVEEGLDPLWTARARRLRTGLRLGSGDPLAERVADWWWRALDGRTAEVVAAIDALPAANRPAELRWLRQWCTRDWRQQPTAADPSIAWLAWLRATADAHGERAVAAARLPPAVAGSLVANAMAYHTTSFRSQQSAAWFALAMEQVGRLARTEGIPAAAKPLAAAVAGGDEGQQLLAAMRFLDAFPPPAPPDSDQRDALADRAASVRLHLQLGAYALHRFIERQFGDPQGGLRLATPFLAAYPDEPLAILLWGRRRLTEQPQGHEHAMRGIETALSGAPRGSPESLVGQAAAWVASWKIAGADALVKRHAEQWQRSRRDAQGEAGFAGIGALIRVLRDHGQQDLLAGPVAAALAADPWSSRLLLFSWDDERKPKPSAERLVAAADALIKDMPWHLEAMGDLARVLSNAKEPTRALALLDPIRADDPGNPWLGLRCSILRKTKRTADAIAAYREYLAHATTFERIHAGRAFGKLLEESGDLAGAEAALKDAAGSWQQSALEDYADFLMRRKRWAEAATWWKNSMERYGGERARAATADCMLRANPDDVDAVIAILTAGDHQSRGVTKTTDELLRTVNLLFNAGAERAVLQLLRARAYPNDGELRYLRAASAMDCGQLLLAEEDLDWLVRDVYPASTWKGPQAAVIIVRATLAAGVWGRRPRVFELMRKHAEKEPGPDADPALRWLAGTLPEAEIATILDGEHDGLLRLCWAWSALAHRDKDGAIGHLEALLAKPARPPWTGSARCLLATLRDEPTPDLLRLATLPRRDIPLPTPPPVPAVKHTSSPTPDEPSSPRVR